jgi:pimeloyl-ACP methyl ester carboxylesterase
MARGSEGAHLLCPACGADLFLPERDELSTQVCGACGAHVLRREDHRHFVFDHRQVTEERLEGLARHVHSELVQIPAEDARLRGTSTVPLGARGLVIFAHGSGSSRLSPRNQAVAQGLNRVGLGTLLFDLLTDDEAEDRRLVFDVPLLASRLLAATGWAEVQTATRGLSIGYFGASTGSAAALWAAAEPGSGVRAVVSRGGRPDLVDARLERVAAPTLLIVGGHDATVLGLNREAAGRMRCHHRVEVVPGATHLFEEPGALERVGHLAAAWLLRYLVRAEQGVPPATVSPI